MYFLLFPEKMRVPVIENVSKWRDHFEKMAKGKLSLENVHNLPVQKGMGGGVISHSKRGDSKIYRVQTGGESGCDQTVISPVKSSINMSKSEIQQKKRAIKRPGRSISSKRAKRPRRGNTKSRKKSKKRGRKKKTGGKRKVPKKTIKRRKKKVTKKKKASTKRKTPGRKRRKRDIFK